MPLKVKNIGISKYKSENFALTTIYISGIDEKNREVYLSITCKLHLVDRLKANKLVSNNMLYIEGFAINLSIFFETLIHSCSVKININARQHSKFLRWKTLISSLTIVLFYSEALVAFQQVKIPDSCDFLFQPSSQQHLTLYSHLFNHTKTKILMCNYTDHAIKLLGHHWLSCITKLFY